jgi:hypothetical protein
MPQWFKTLVFEIFLMLDFIQKEIILLSYSIQMKEEIAGLMAHMQKKRYV